MKALNDDEIVAADSVVTIDPETRTRTSKTRMRVMSHVPDLLEPEKNLSRYEVDALLQRPTDAA